MTHSQRVASGTSALINTEKVRLVGLLMTGVKAGAHEQPPAVEAESVPLSLPEARRRWAEHRRLHYPAPSDRPDSHPPAAHRDGAPPLARAAAALDFSPHRHLGVSRSPPPPDPWVRGLLGCARAGWWPWPCLIPAARLARGC